MLRRLRQKIRLLRSDFWKTNKWFLHYDNARLHSALIIQEFLTRSHPTVSHSFYSPDLAPADYFRLSTCFKERKFNTRESIIEQTKAKLKTIPKEAFSKAFEILKARRQRCINAGGDYLEGDPE